jgi:hypothetical protein
MSFAPAAQAFEAGQEYGEVDPFLHSSIVSSEQRLRRAGAREPSACAKFLRGEMPKVDKVRRRQ